MLLMPMGRGLNLRYIEMANTNKTLTLTSFNCEHADNFRLPFLKELFNKCDFLLIQEHGLLKSKLSWFHELGENVGIHGVSAMKEDQLPWGRPHGGAAILWHGTVHNRVTPLSWDSSRCCAVTVDVAGETLLLVCVYMPCDDWRHDKNIIEYKNILNEISVICNSTNASHVCIGGDFNTDISRNTPQTEALKLYLEDSNLYCCALDQTCNIDYTYCSKINGSTSFIDHFVISQNLKDKLNAFLSSDPVNNPSDHAAISCNIECNMSYNMPEMNKESTDRPAWHSANDRDIEMYKDCLDYNLLNIQVHLNIINCNNVMCNEHESDIT